MRLLIDEKQKEVKEHGSYKLPVRMSMESLKNFDQGNFAWHWHPEIEITYFVKGEMYYLVNGKEYHVREGEVLFCNTNALHAGNMSNGEDCQYISLTFHPRIIYGYIGSEVEQELVRPILENAALGSMHFLKDMSDTEVIIKKMRQIYELLDKKPEMYSLQIQINLMEIWKCIYENSLSVKGYDKTGNERDIERLREILNYIHVHYSEQISLENIAGNVNLCKSECCRFFKKQMKETLFEYLLKYRISMSIIYLKEGMNITEAGFQSGFLNPAYFSRVFKRVMGKSPRQYKAEVK